MHRYIDHGEGMICLRILDPFVYDSGRYTCIVRSDYGKCETSCDVVISEVLEQDELEMKPVFIKSPQTVVAAYGTVVSFCARVSPVHAKVEWSVCGRVLTENTRGILVSLYYSFVLTSCNKLCQILVSRSNGEVWFERFSHGSGNRVRVSILVLSEFYEINIKHAKTSATIYNKMFAWRELILRVVLSINEK